MPIPDVKALYQPILKIAADDEEHTDKAVEGPLADKFNLTEEERQLKTKAGVSALLSRVNWAVNNLASPNQGLLERPGNGRFKITAKGRALSNGITVPPDLAADNPPDEELGPPLDGKFEQLCDATYLSRPFFQDFEKLLLTKKQVILEGAPGTGKTFVAQMFAEWFAGPGKQVKLVQFHESYGYEDFVYGIKPMYDDATGVTAFRNRPGVFLKFCEDARKEQKKFVLLIDEINRGKPSRIFGELLYLLEYRNRAVELQSGSTFEIPSNVYLIGTMNTIDKSIALVDYALRRRFSFLALEAVHNGKSVLLRKWLDKKRIKKADEVERLFIALNNLVSAKDEALTIGHSYFMAKEAEEAGEFSPELLNFIWKYNIIPLVKEYEYELKAGEVENKYRLENVRKQAGLS